jgi:predicted aspartyl protease
MHSIVKSFVPALLAVASVAAVAPAVAAECKPLAIVDSLPLEMLPSGRPATIVKISGSPKKMLLDTGAAISVITAKTANDLNLVQSQSYRYGAVKFVNGAVVDRLARLPTLEIGQRLREENAQYFILPSENTEFDGLLSDSFLKQYDADFDFAMKRFNLFSPDHCEGKVIYWQPKALAMVPFTLNESSQIRLRVELDGKRIDAILDTGASSTTLNQTMARRLFDLDVSAPDVEKVGEMTGGYTANVYQRKFKTLTLEGITIADPMITLLPDMMSGPVGDRETGSLTRRVGNVEPMLLGINILSKLHLNIAYKERKLYVTDAGTPPPAAPQAPANPPQ